jgi:amino-acid N-acetyltransferase
MSETHEKPRRIRVHGLQEGHVPDVLRIDAACAAMYYAIGFDGAEVPIRHASDFVRLTRDHNVRVAEADRVPSGFLAWRDESPGIAYLADVSVHPESQRLGIGGALLDAMMDEARDANLEHIVVRCWDRAVWARSFYDKRGFVVVDGRAPEKVRTWRAEREASGRPLTRPGESVLWAAVGKKAVIEEESTTDGTMEDYL